MHCSPTSHGRFPRTRRAFTLVVSSGHGAALILFLLCGRCAAPFMAKQLSADHFCHIGADIIADEDGTPWLIEANCPPNLYAYTNEPDHPDEKAITPLIRAMLSDLMRLFVLPVVTKGTIPAVRAVVP